MEFNDKRPYRRCVGITLFNRFGHVFVAQRIDQKAIAWQMPQGGIEKDENPREAALRELEEEIGTSDVRVLGETRDWHSYDLPRHLADKIWAGRYRGQIQKWFAMEYLGKDSAINTSGVKNPEFSEWRWVEPVILPSLAVKFKKEIYQTIVNEFSLLAPKLVKN